MSFFVKGFFSLVLVVAAFFIVAMAGAVLEDFPLDERGGAIGIGILFFVACCFLRMSRDQEVTLGLKRTPAHHFPRP